jgi:hypothetical protein
MINVSCYVPPIEESVDLSEPLRNVTDRYYSRLYRIDEDRSVRNDLCVLVHSNRVCLVTLAPSHPIIAENLNIENIDYDVSKTVNRQSNKARGKSKKGAQILGDKSVLCNIQTSGRIWPVEAVVKGKLVSMNKSLLVEPGLIVSHTWSEGHIAIVLPGLAQFEEVKRGLLTQDEYEKQVGRERNGDNE